MAKEWPDAARSRVASTPENTVSSARAIGGDSGGEVATVVDQAISSHPVHEFVDWRAGGKMERGGDGSRGRGEGKTLTGRV